MPDIPGIEHAISSNEALELPSLPKRMVIVGGGYIAVEFAGIFSSLGVEVTNILRADTVLRGFDEDIRLSLDKEMNNRGINIVSNTMVNSIEDEGAEFKLHFENGISLKPILLCMQLAVIPTLLIWAWKILAFN